MNRIDKLTQYLVSNGDVPAWTNQEIYEYAWAVGIRPVREDRLKPKDPMRRRKRGPRHEADSDAWWDRAGPSEAVMAE